MPFLKKMRNRRHSCVPPTRANSPLTTTLTTTTRRHQKTPPQKEGEEHSGESKSATKTVG